MRWFEIGLVVLTFATGIIWLLDRLFFAKARLRNEGLLEAKELHGLAARLDGRVVGIAHYLFHTNVWVDDVCYLADLFVDEQVRGQGAARLLIEAVADKARQRGCQRYYWLTQQHNVRARGLYDKVARFAGFIRYDYPLNPA